MAPVQHVFQDALAAAVKDACRAESQDDMPASDDSIEIVSAGRKRNAASPAPDGPARKKKANGNSELHPVLKLDLHFEPPPTTEVAVRKVLSKYGKHLVDSGGTVPLCDVVYHHARDSAKTPHRLYLRHADTNAALVELDPIDSACPAARAWVQWITPPPLTKSGKPYKRPKNASRAQKRDPNAVVPNGAGGLVDALAYLGDSDGQGVSVKYAFLLEVDTEDNESEAGTIRFHLTFDVSVDPADFFSALYTRSRRILIDHLLPSTNPLGPGATPEAPDEASVDFFYACLRRAPRTSNGLPISPGSSPAKTPEGRATPIETDEERQTRLRREAKGKQRAIEPDEADEAVDRTGDFDQEGAAGDEDELIYPDGLSVKLMPFQARSVRWMLAREGKRIKPRKPVDFAARDDAMQIDDEQADDGDDDDVGADLTMRPDKRKGKARANPDNSDDEQNSDRSPPELQDLDEAILKEMRRGPLWEQVKLPIIDARTGDVVKERELWLNRTLLSFTESDPVDIVGASGAATPIKPESDGEDEAVQEKASRKVVGGREGHGLLAEEVGLGKTVEALSLILTRESHVTYHALPTLAEYPATSPRPRRRPPQAASLLQPCDELGGPALRCYPDYCTDRHRRPMGERDRAPRSRLARPPL